ncbi:5698_t:CDS:2, partial [Cetraspora pellucida]
LSKQQNGQEYKAHLLKLALNSINHFLKMRDLQEKGLGKIQGAHILNLEEQQEDGRFNFIRYVAKNNQRGINEGNAQIIPISADHPGTQEPCYDFQLYLSKHKANANDHLYLQINKFMKEIGQRTKITVPEKLLLNNSERKTATQILHDNKIPEQTIMDITGHHSMQGVQAYKKTNELQKLIGMSSLISLYDPNLSNSSKEIQL